MEKIKSGAFCDYVQCIIKVQERVREQFTKFPPIFKNTNVCRQDIVSLMQAYAEREKLMKQVYRFVEYIPVRRFKNFVQCSSSMLVVKEARIQTPVLLQKLWSCLPTACMVIKLLTAFTIQLKNTWMMKRHMQQSTKICSIDQDISNINFRR